LLLKTKSAHLVHPPFFTIIKIPSCFEKDQFCSWNLARVLMIAAVYFEFAVFRIVVGDNITLDEVFLGIDL
jgi:hypothetical protein